MRAAVLVAVAGCGFSHGTLGTSDGGGDGAAGDTGSGGADGATVDARVAVPRTRPIDLADARVAGGPHIDFPVLVALSADWLRTVTAGGDVAHPMGFDIRFSADAAGLIPLAHDVEHYAGDVGALIAWVKVPTLIPSTVFYLHYGDPAATTNPQNRPMVWSSFRGVWHLDGVFDASGNNGSVNTTNVTGAAGHIFRAVQFDGTTSDLDVASATAIDDLFGAGGTAEGWFYATGWGENSYGRVFDKGHTAGWSLFVNNVDPVASLSFLHGSASNGWGHWSTPAQSVTLGAWHHGAVVYNKDLQINDPVLYLNGAPVTVVRVVQPSAAMVSDASHDLHVGNRSTRDRTFDGRLDELRVSTLARSPEWIATTYQNQLDPSGFAPAGPPL